jgi:hypothetical protein
MKNNFKTLLLLTLAAISQTIFTMEKTQWFSIEKDFIGKDYVCYLINVSKEKVSYILSLLAVNELRDQANLLAREDINRYSKDGKRYGYARFLRPRMREVLTKFVIENNEDLKAKTEEIISYAKKDATVRFLIGESVYSRIDNMGNEKKEEKEQMEQVPANMKQTKYCNEIQEYLKK